MSMSAAKQCWLGPDNTPAHMTTSQLLGLMPKPTRYQSTQAPSMAHGVPALAKGRVIMDGCWGRENQFSSRMKALG